jgi:hypothetical protein
MNATHITFLFNLEKSNKGFFLINVGKVLKL